MALSCNDKRNIPGITDAEYFVKMRPVLQDLLKTDDPEIIEAVGKAMHCVSQTGYMFPAKKRTPQPLSREDLTKAINLYYLFYPDLAGSSPSSPIKPGEAMGPDFGFRADAYRRQYEKEKQRLAAKEGAATHSDDADEDMGLPEIDMDDF